MEGRKIGRKDVRKGKEEGKKEGGKQGKKEGIEEVGKVERSDQINTGHHNDRIALKRIRHCQ